MSHFHYRAVDSSQLCSRRCQSFFTAKEIPNTRNTKATPSIPAGWSCCGKTAMHMKVWLSPCLKLTFCCCISNHKRTSFHLVLPCIATYQVSTCPHVPRLFVNMPVCVKIGFHLNLKLFSAFATCVTKLFNSGSLPKVRTA